MSYSQRRSCRVLPQASDAGRFCRDKRWPQVNLSASAAFVTEGARIGGIEAKEALAGLERASNPTSSLWRGSSIDGRAAQLRRRVLAWQPSRSAQWPRFSWELTLVEGTQPPPSLPHTAPELRRPRPISGARRRHGHDRLDHGWRQRRSPRPTHGGLGCLRYVARASENHQ